MQNICKKDIDFIFDDVILPLKEHFYNDNDILSLKLSNKEKLQKFSRLVTFILLLIKADKSELKEIISKHQKLELEICILRFYVEMFLNLYQNTLEKNSINCENFNKHKKHILEHFDEFKKEEQNDEFIDFDDGFLDFDVDTKDSLVNKITYSEEEKIDAKTFMETANIEQEDIDEIVDSIDDFEAVKFELNSLTEEYIKQLEKIITNLEKVFNLNYEFNNLLDVLSEFNTLLVNIDINSIENSNRELLFTLINGVMADLINFTKSVFINQDINDIHYFDASLLSDIAYINLLLKGKEDEKK